jgi:gamma-glutamyltranspeptidase/glutathione hydrolase
VDAQGNAVATTTTINGGYGSAVWVRGGGFFMNNEMDDFATQPGTANMFGLVQGEANAIQPGKRMLSAMSPTIVLDPKGDVLLVVGAAGGPTIITATTQVILNVIEFGMPLTEAMRAPRMHHQALPDAIRHESQGFSDATLRRLRRMGHELTAQGGIANVNAVMRSGAVWHGVHEPRGSGGAVGY